MQRATVFFLLLFQMVALGARVDRASSKTEHFIFSIDIRKSSKIMRPAALFETCFTKLTTFFDFVPKAPIRVLLLDEDDIGNGWAYVAQGWIVINLTSVRLDYRGERRWLPTVISHELAHLISLQKMGLKKRFLGLGLSNRWLHGNFLEHREETQLPYRDFPNWLAEGLAQYGSQVCGFDTLDSRREMLLRTAWLSGKLLNLKEMSAFAWDGRNNELVYNQGYFFVHFLYDKFGAEAMNRMLDLCRKEKLHYAFKKALGQTLTVVFGEWRSSLDSRYTGLKPCPFQLEAPGDFPAGEAVLKQGNPTAAGANNQIFFTSSRQNDFGIASLFFKSPAGVISRLYYGVECFLRHNPQRNKILFISKKKHLRHNALVNELFQLDVNRLIRTQITNKGRIISADYDSNGEIYIVRENGGITEFGRLQAGQFKAIPLKPDSLEILSIQRGENAGFFYAVTAGHSHTDIYLIQAHLGIAEPFVATPANETDPFFYQGRLYFSTDFDGAFNIYSQQGGTWFRHTAINSGGAFQPHVRDNTLYFTAYTSRGFLLASQTLENQQERMAVKNSPLPSHSPPQKVPLRYIPYRDGVKYLGTGLFCQLTGHPQQGVDIPVLNQERDSLIRFDTATVPAFQELSFGGQFIWLHPAGEAAFILAANLSRQLDFSNLANSHLSLLDIYYFRQFSVLSLDALLHWESVSFPAAEIPAGTYKPVFSQIILHTALSIPAGRFGRLATMAEISLGILSDREETIEDFAFGGPLLLGGKADYQRFNPGRDFINSGKAYSVSMAFGPGPENIVVGGGTTDFFFNIARRFFIHSFAGVQALNSAQVGGVGGMAGASLFTHLPLSSNTGSHRGILPKRLFPFVAINTSSKGSKDTNMPYFLKNTLNHNSRSFRPVYRIAPPAVFTGNTDRSVSGQTGLTLKVVSVFSRAAFWTAAVSFKPRKPSDEPVWYLRFGL